MKDLIVKNVDVMGDSIKAAKDATGNIWVGVRWVCDALDMTEGQMKRQIMNIQKDMVFSEGGSNQIPLPTGQGEQDVFCIRHDFIPLWLAKITITDKTKNERPDFAKKLLQYQLKAKDILSDAFLPKHPQFPTTIPGQIQLLAQGHVALEAKIDSVREDLEKFKNDMPILGVEESKITTAVRKKGVECLGGKESPAYNDKSLRSRLYSDLHRQLRRQFGVSSYKAIKRNQTDIAVDIIRCYAPPLVLAETIETVNAQMEMEGLEG